MAPNKEYLLLLAQPAIKIPITDKEEIDEIYEFEFEARIILGNPNEFTKRFMENYLINLDPMYQTVDTLALRHTLNEIIEQPQW